MYVHTMSVWMVEQQPKIQNKVPGITNWFARMTSLPSIPNLSFLLCIHPLFKGILTTTTVSIDKPEQFLKALGTVCNPWNICLGSTLRSVTLVAFHQSSSRFLFAQLPEGFIHWPPLGNHVQTVTKPFKSRQRATKVSSSCEGHRHICQWASPPTQSPNQSFSKVRSSGPSQS